MKFYYECKTCNYAPTESKSDFAMHVGTERHKTLCPDEDTMYLMWKKRRDDLSRHLSEKYIDEHVQWIGGESFRCTKCDSNLVTYTSVRTHKMSKRHNQ